MKFSFFKQVLSFCCLLFFTFTQAQTDTLTLSLPDAERIFLEKNFQLLAQKFSINMAEAAIIQAKLLPNPNLYVLGNVYNPTTKKILPFSPNSPQDLTSNTYNSGEVTIQIQQLILLAGKRSKLTRLSESNRDLQRLAFEDALRSLRFQLYTAYANLFYDLQSYKLLQEEAEKQMDLVRAFRILLAQGGASQYEVTRLEAELQSLRSDLTDLAGQVADGQATLRIFLARKEKVFIAPAPIAPQETALPPLNVAIDSANANRPDLKIAIEQLENAKESLSLEKARSVPDLTAGYMYDSYGNAYRNFSGVYLQMDLPFFNRNQGNVKMAKYRVKSTEAGIENQHTVAESEVINAFQKLQSLNSQSALIPEDYRRGLQNISTEATINYNRKVINLLDYLDKIRTYKQAQLNLINLQNNLFHAKQYFNFVTNTRFFQ